MPEQHQKKQLHKNMIATVTQFLNGEEILSKLDGNLHYQNKNSELVE